MCNNTDTNTDSVQNSMSSKDAIDAEDASIYVQYKGITHNIPIRDTVTDIIHAIASATSTDPATIKLLPRTRRTPPITLSTLAPSIHPNDRFLLMASSIEAVRHVQNAQDLPGMAGFDHEARIIAQRTRTADDDAVVVLPRTPYTFQQFRTWAEPGLTLVPPESAALHMLHRLAADRGIQAVMTQYKWTVGLLAEMPPEGFVGISPVCVLGYNTNKGQEIHLRFVFVWGVAVLLSKQCCETNHTSPQVAYG